MTFHFRVNGGAETKMESLTGFYVSAAAAIPALFGIEDYPLEIEIWYPKVVKPITLPNGEVMHGYGPYFYRIDEPGGPVLAHPAPGDRPKGAG